MCDSDVTARGLVCIDLDVKGCYIYTTLMKKL